MTKELNQFMPPKQRAVLDLVADHINRLGFAPTQNEVAKSLGMKRSLVLYHLRRLEEKGVIKRAGQGKRGIVLK